MTASRWSQPFAAAARLLVSCEEIYSWCPERRGSPPEVPSFMKLVVRPAVAWCEAYHEVYGCGDDTWRLTADWLMFRCSPACVKLPASAAA